VNAERDRDPTGFKLRVIPFSATVRFLPMGRNNGHRLQPYIGAGVGVFSWRYSESGQFLRHDR